MKNIFDAGIIVVRHHKLNGEDIPDYFFLMKISLMSQNVNG